MDLPTYGAHYLFSLPLIAVGVVCLIGDRIRKQEPWLVGAQGAEAEDRQRRTRWGMLLVVLWLLAAAWSALVTDDAHMGRSAILFYPAVLMIGYAVYRVGKRQRVLALVLAAVFAVGAGRFAVDYFAPATQHALGRMYYAGLEEALEASRGRPMDTMYITKTRPEENQYGIPEMLLVEYAQQLDARYVHGDAEMQDPDGRVWEAFQDRYQLADMQEFWIDPEEEALYILLDVDLADRREDFDPALFSFERYGDYYLITPNVLKGAYINSTRGDAQ
jgi:hypothetical protein